MNIRRRLTSVTAKELVYIKKSTLVGPNLMVAARDIDGDEDKKERCMLLGKVYYIEALKMSVESTDSLPKPVRLYVDFDMFNESQYWVYFKIRRCDVERYFKCLRIPDTVRFENRSKMSGVEVFLRSMYELVNGEDQFHICENIFCTSST